MAAPIVPLLDKTGDEVAVAVRTSGFVNCVGSLDHAGSGSAALEKPKASLRKRTPAARFGASTLTESETATPASP